MRSLAPLPNARSRPPSRSTSASDRPDQLGDAQRRCRRAPRGSPRSRAGPRARRRRRARSAPRPRPRQRLRAGPRDTRAAPRPRPDRGRQALLGRRKRCSERTATVDPRHRRRRPALARRWRDVRVDVGLADISRAPCPAREPGDSTRAGRAGTPRACWPTRPRSTASQVRNSSTSSGSSVVVEVDGDVASPITSPSTARWRGVHGPASDR